MWRPEGILMLRLLKLGVVIAIVLAVAAVGGWYFFLKSDPAPRARIVETLTVATAAGATADGNYTLDANNTKSFVGYRVTEKLVANVVQTEATGRTSRVQGLLRVTGTTLDGVTITADMTALRSDNDLRDGRLRDQGIEYGRFPTAKFALASPITLDATPTAGTTVNVQAVGDLTLHGVTKRVTVAIEARWDGRIIQVVRSLPVAFADYGIRAPSSTFVASVDDHGELEFQLFFTKS